MFRFSPRSALAILFALTVASAQAADGDLDSAFVTDAEYPGYGFYHGGFGTDRSDTVTAVLPRADGRVVLVGTLQSGVDEYRMSVFRIGANGQPDNSFGSLGLRTYVLPCAEGRVTDAVLDGQQRLWMSVAGCGDFIVYRLTADGDLDTSLLGSGVLTIPFDRGDSNDDDATALTVLADGSLLVAGAVDAEPLPLLAVAHFDEQGQPVADFGDAGKATVAMSIGARVVNGIHRMDDGRLVLTGYRTGNGNTHLEYVVRLQPGGLADAGFGTDGPGYSLYDPLALPDPLSGTSGSSLLLHDGSVLRVGALDGDFYLGRWLADGQRDLTLGPAGLRRYALDFGDGSNDYARRIVRQGDGKFVVAGESIVDGVRGVSVIRLRADFELDTSFGDGGKRRYLAEIASDGAHAMRARDLLVLPGRILVGCDTATGPGTAQIQTLMALSNDLLFADSFD